MAQRRPRNIEQTRAALLESARELFTRHGFGGVGVREIAERADVDKALITRYFGSKEGLFTEAVSGDFSVTRLLEGPRDEVGRRLAEHVVSHVDTMGFDPLIMIIRSLGDPETARYCGGVIEERVIRPLTEVMGGAGSEAAAAFVQAGQRLCDPAHPVVGDPPLTSV
ncbi:helix-turn-helix domain-containing protein [Streptomyces sp. NPDC097610]|uniref:TetR/AcrR family transcriptional regulator n=1 Tax=Streptomyces sp. NPDC097610 TaxID=3157227 RepID=UPI0033228EEF